MLDRNGRRRKCIVADDDSAIRQVLYLVLGHCNFELSGFASACDVVESCRREAPDLLFLDVALEGSDAIDVIRALGAQRYRGVIQLISGSDRPLLDQIKRVGEQHGLTMLPPLRKPFRAAHIEAAIRAYFDQESGRVEAAEVPTRADGDSGISVGLDEVIREGWLEFFYQPKMDLRPRSVVGAELLARCRHPEHGILQPASFLTGASKEDMLGLSMRALATSLNVWNVFARDGFLLKLAVNVTVNDLVKLPIAAMVRKHRPVHDGWPGLILEVTEDQAVRDIQLTQEIAAQLRIYGVSLSLDDFGTGYSHLARLCELPFAELKLDRRLVANCGKDPNSTSLCQTAIELAHKFRAVAVAEGIENISELNALIGMGCDVGQGYLFSTPIPQDLFIVLLKKMEQPAHRISA